MSYDTIDPVSKRIWRHRGLPFGRDSLQELPTKTIRCDACGWTTQAIAQPADQTLDAVLKRCICGGTLRVTTAIKDATR